MGEQVRHTSAEPDWSRKKPAGSHAAHCESPAVMQVNGDTQWSTPAHGRQSDAPVCGSAVRKKPVWHCVHTEFPSEVQVRELVQFCTGVQREQTVASCRLSVK
jgi:hypothetical protein